MNHREDRKSDCNLRWCKTEADSVEKILIYTNWISGIILLPSLSWKCEEGSAGIKFAYVGSNDEVHLNVEPRM